MSDNQSVFDILNFSFSKKREATYYQCRLSDERWLCHKVEAEKPAKGLGRQVIVPVDIPQSDHAPYLMVKLAYPVSIQK